MSQERLSEHSLRKSCYLSVATIKRSELGFSVSNNTINNYCILFNTNEETLKKKEIKNKKKLISVEVRDRIDSILDQINILSNELPSNNEINDDLEKIIKKLRLI